MRNKPLPVFFLLRMPLGRLAPPLPAAYPLLVPLPSSGAVHSHLPALLSAYHGVGRGRDEEPLSLSLSASPPLLACSGIGSASVSIAAVCLLARSVGRFVSVM